LGRDSKIPVRNRSYGLAMLYLKTFGGLSVTIDGAPGTGAGQQRKMLALLALLAATGRHGTSRDKLIAYLWPETDTKRGRGLLKQACYALRHDLGAPDLFLGSTELQLNPAVISSDVESFEAALEQHDLARAVSLHVAPFLDGFYLNGEGDFERWVESERSRFTKRVCDALETLAKTASSRGDHRAAVEWWRRFVEIEPLSSRAILGLMTALDDLGERADALRQGRAYETLVREELEAEPPSEVAALIRRLHHQSDDGGRRNAIAASPVDRTAVGDSAPAVPVTLVRRMHRAHILSLVAVGAVVLLAAGTSYALFERRAPAGVSDFGAGSTRKLLAVLPFENVGSPLDDYFADGLSEAIATRLSSLHGLGVIARQSVLQYYRTTKSPGEIGKELGVEYVLTGTVRWENPRAQASRVRVNSTLVRASDATILWANQYDTLRAGVFAVQSSVAERCAAALHIALAASERRDLVAQPTDNVAAYDAYLRGWELRTRSLDAPDLKGAARLFRQAVTLDSGFATAWAELAAVDLIIYMDYLDRTDGPLAEARAGLDRAVLLDPDLARARLSLGDYYAWIAHDYQRALQEFRRVERTRPNLYSVSGAMADALRRLGKWEESITYYHRAVELNPRGADLIASLGDVYSALRRYPEAIAAYDRAYEIRPLISPALDKALSYLSQTGDLTGTQHLLPDVALNIAPTGLEFVVTTLADVVPLLDERQQTALLQLAPGALEGDTAGLALAKAMAYRALQQSQLARAFFDTARVALEARLAVRGDAYGRLRCMLGVALAGLGRTAEAIRVGRQAVNDLPVSKDAMEGPLMIANLARIYVLVNEPEKAIDQLEIVLSRPGPLSAGWLRADPFWDPLRGSPRFQRLVAVRN
jgi:DNA-binding SARP family transcriptional activator/TolB-like protein